MVDISLLKELHEKCAGRVRYKLGAKASLSAQSSDITHIDCSGYVRWILARASRQTLLLPDGSQNQREWVVRQAADGEGWKALQRYSDVQYAAQDPSRLFVAFLWPNPGKAWPRHVWLVHKGRTIESAGGGMKGVGSQDWRAYAAHKNVQCFEILQ